jgi:hypothetical protein
MSTLRVRTLFMQAFNYAVVPAVYTKFTTSSLDQKKNHLPLTINNKTKITTMLIITQVIKTRLSKGFACAMLLSVTLLATQISKSPICSTQWVYATHEYWQWSCSCI